MRTVFLNHYPMLEPWYSVSWHEGDSVLQILAAQDLQLAADTAGRRFDLGKPRRFLSHALDHLKFRFQGNPVRLN